MAQLFIVYCIDTEGPMYEPLEETFKRLKSIFNLNLEPTKKNLIALQNKNIDLNGIENEVAKVVNPHLLAYNDTWDKIDTMLDIIMNPKFRNKFSDSKGRGLIYNWHCMDHAGFSTNERRRDIGFGNIFKHFKEKINEYDNLDKIHWHFHPLSFNKEAHINATSYDNSYETLHQIIIRRIIDNNWFPTANRAGFNTIRQDSSFFLEQWIPFDFSNASEYEDSSLSQQDLAAGRYGDWRRSPKEWKPYNPSYEDYQSKGSMNRYSTKCLNIGTRMGLITDSEIEKAFQLSEDEGKAILSFTNHDFRNMEIDIEDIYSRIFTIAEKYKSVELHNCDSVEAMQKYLYTTSEIEDNKLILDYELKTSNGLSKLIITAVNGNVFGTQPYLAIKTQCGRYFHDNFDELEYGKTWSYVFDRYTMDIKIVESLKVAANDKYGNTEIIDVSLKGVS